MEENKEDIIKYHQMKRKKHKIKLAKWATILLVVGIILIAIYLILNKKYFVAYREDSDVKYRVNLQENEFYNQSYLEEDIDVIASLIKNINVDFKYNLALAEKLEYKYSYRILAEMEVKEKSKTNTIYKEQQEILSKGEQEANSTQLEITEKINIDYNKYNEKINKLLEFYRLQNTTSQLSVTLYLNIINKVTGERINTQNNVMSIQMPLTTKTVELTINENAKNDYGKILLQDSQYENTEYLLVLGLLMVLGGVIALGSLIKYISDTRSAEKMYDDELKKIIFDYKSYIQKINNQIDYQEYKIINIDTFRELIGMREELQSPILMYTEEENKRTTFMMINENLLFMHILEATKIRENLIKKSKEKKERKKKRNENNK